MDDGLKRETTMTIAVMRKCDGVCIDLIDTKETYDTLDGWTRLRQALPAERIAQLQHSGTCVDADTEIYAAIA